MRRFPRVSVSVALAVALVGVLPVASPASPGALAAAPSVGGVVWAWGANDYGQLGDGGHHDRLHPVQVPGLDDVVALSGGGHHSLAVRPDGTVWAWGDNSAGQLGDGR